MLKRIERKIVTLWEKFVRLIKEWKPAEKPIPRCDCEVPEECCR